MEFFLRSSERKEGTPSKFSVGVPDNVPEGPYVSLVVVRCPKVAGGAKRVLVKANFASSSSSPLGSIASFSSDREISVSGPLTIHFEPTKLCELSLVDYEGSEVEASGEWDVRVRIGGRSSLGREFHETKFAIDEATINALSTPRSPRKALMEVSEEAAPGMGRRVGEKLLELVGGFLSDVGKGRFETVDGVGGTEAELALALAKGLGGLGNSGKEFLGRVEERALELMKLWVE